jgi:hypothetical protein
MSEGSIHWVTANHAILYGQENGIAARKEQQLRPAGSRVRVHNLEGYCPINRALVVTRDERTQLHFPKLVYRVLYTVLPRLFQYYLVSRHSF